LSGTLNDSTGWVDLFLRFKTADSLEYTPEPAGESDVRSVDTITLSSMGMVFRGIGNPLTIHLDGFNIVRNHFQDYSAHGNGLYLTGDDYMTAPLSEYSLSKGTIELWIRPDYNYTASDYYSVLKNRALFHCNNNANDVFGVMFSSSGMEIYFGSVIEGITDFILEDLGLDIMDYLFHLGIVFSNDGTQISNDGSTIRVYINDVLIAKSFDTWDINDNKHFNFVLGGKSAVSLKQHRWIDTSSVDAVISQLKIYNYCKTSFINSIKNVEDAHDNLIKPSNLIEISRDNLTYYKVRDTNLPFKFADVPAGDTVSIYTRPVLPENMVGKENRTANLLLYWDVSG
jgi:hypothetical protein